MAYRVKKSEHCGPKKGRGAYWGRKRDAKKESSRYRREYAKQINKLNIGKIKVVKDFLPDPSDLVFKNDS